MTHYSFSLSNLMELSKRALGFAALLGLSACGAKLEQVGGESHFLSSCDGSCSGNLACIDSQCTLECTGNDDCSAFAGASCATAASPARCVAVVTCEGHAVGEAWKCDCNTCWCESDGSIASTLIGCSAAPPVMSTPMPAAVPTANPPQDGSCSYLGRTFANRSTWLGSDGCNDNLCMGGVVASTAKACSPQSTNCTDADGSVHAAGTTWKCGANGCNDCSCGESQRIAFSAQECAVTCSYAGRSYAEGATWLYSDGCNEANCTGGNVLRTDKACPQSDECSDPDGTAHAAGTTWKCGDGCDECTCQGFQFISTKAVTCRTGTCTVGDKTYKLDETWQCACNQCTCTDGGRVSTTLKACAKAELCGLPQDIGPCEAAIPSFYFNIVTTECEAFSYGGCQGNENRFETLEQCQTTCQLGF